MEIPKQFIFKEDEDGNSYATDNKEWQVYIQNEKYNLFLERSGIPEFYWNINFENYIGNRKSVEFRKIKHYADHLNEKSFEYVHLYLWGIQNSQKTALACNIGKSAIKKGLKVKFVLAGDLITDLLKLQGYNSDESLNRKIEDLKTNYDLILIDDIADAKKSIMWNKEESKPLVLVEWDRFFRKVFYNKTKIILTSNFSFEECKSYFGESIYELLDRNTEKIHLTESVKEIRKLKVQSAFDGIK